jgi:formate hydrogenlyase subunit 3/multisubunit Na+/H+ antiporter MnhD subunit
MNGSVLWVPILLPVLAGLLVLLIRRPESRLRDLLAVVVTLANLVAVALLFGRDLTYGFTWGSLGTVSLRLYRFSGFIALAIATFGFLVALFSYRFMRGRPFANQYYAYLLFTIGAAEGAVLADHLVLLLFFWEGLLGTLYGMIAIGSPGAAKTATKAFVICGITDLCLLFGVVLTGIEAKTLVMSQIHLPVASWAAVGMVFMCIGAISKGGSMPFHSWIPDAAQSAPTPFMAILPASLEKLLGIYLLARITLDFFALTPESWVSTLLMTVGAITIVLAVLMALVQKEYKRLLSYHAISQVGYMILGVGTAVPAGIIGGLFHMVNNALYKSGLFLSAGAVEKQAGTTDLRQLGGLAAKMPLTFACFLITAMSISGVPPFNGFFSKELVYDAALERGTIFYCAALLGSFLTAASFLKLGHAAYLGRRDPANDAVREAPVSMLVPMVAIAGVCILFGLYNTLPINQLLMPVYGANPPALEHPLGGMPTNTLLVGLTIVALAGALLNHLIGFRTSGSALHAVDHIHYAPGLAYVYDRAEKRYFDPYDIGLKVAGGLAKGLSAVDRGVDWVYNTLTVRVSYGVARGIRLAHSGSYALYILWSLAGSLIVIAFLL